MQWQGESDRDVLSRPRKVRHGTLSEDGVGGVVAMDARLIYLRMRGIVGKA